MKSFLRVIRRYFKAYGGWKGLFSSPFFLFSLCLTSLASGVWLSPLGDSPKWIGISQDIIPDLLGFSLGSYAFMFSLNDRVRSALIALGNKSGVAYLDNVNAIFLHFIIVQFLSVIWSFLFEFNNFHYLFRYFFGVVGFFEFSYIFLYFVSSFLGAFLMFYSFSLVVAASIAVFRLASIKH
ncbi:hypothetical protein L6172_11210 [Thalassospiraceae bacterium SW-3-3]|nr:hypothetical protein L6172_11210 [Thalassospiraceae bacterium SW-3-3]